MRGMTGFSSARLGLLFLLVLGVLVGAGAALAATPSTYYVSPSGTDSTCAAGQSSSTPLKTIGFAVGCANADTTAATATAASPDIINIATGTYDEHLSISADVNLVGASGAIVDGTASGRIVLVGSGYTVGISNLTLQNGLAAAANGGALSNSGTVNITSSTLSNNFASFGGGAVQNSGTLTITGSTFTGNSTAVAGGAIENEGTLTVTNSTFSGNPISPCGCEPAGGAVLWEVGGTASFSNSTIAGNTEDESGDLSTCGVICVDPSFSSTVSFGATILANNTGGNCTGSITDEGYNLEDTSPSTCGFSSANNDIVGSDPMLGPLADNGGPTRTMALAPGSPAIDVIPSTNTLCSASSNDQRGAARPDSGESACDIGAYEYQEVQCSAGSYSASGFEPCTLAPAGSFAAGTGNTASTLCAAGTFSSTAGQASCASAPAGSFAAGTGNTASTLCAAGTFSSTAGQASCASAPAGSFAAGTGNTASTLCPAGTFSSTAGQASCASAPAGSFAAGTGNTASTLCPAGTFSSTAGQASCASAPAGSFAAGTGNTASTLCPAGTFSSTAGQASCASAPAGSFAAGTGNTASTLCPAGTFSSTAGQASCTPAPAGKFVAGGGATAATPCAAGSYQPNTGQTSCILAGIGFFVPSTGQASQTACPLGQTTTALGATSCVTTISVLISQVQGVGPGTSLYDQASQIQAYINAHDKAHACSALTNFIGLVKVQTGKKLTNAQAATFTTEAQTVEASLGC